jgi:hypothetical protein
MMPPISILVEGNLDEAVAREIIDAAGGTVGTVYGRRGADYIEKKITGFNQLAQGLPILTLVDLMDIDSNCPAEVVREWLPHRHEQMLLRLVVREIESWILADRTSIARFLGIRKSLIPHHPETLDDPKESLVECARNSPHTGLRNDLVPRDPTVNDEGKGYTNRMERFIREQWNLKEATKNASSLRRCVQAVNHLVYAKTND